MVMSGSNAASSAVRSRATTGVDGSPGESIHRFAGALQVLAGDCLWASKPQVLDRFDALAARAPSFIKTRVDEIVVGVLLVKTLRNLWRTFGVERPSDLPSTVAPTQFRYELRLMRRQGSASKRRIVADFDRLLHRRYAEQGLCADEVADQLGLSVWKLVRALVVETGNGFRSHLRRVRIERAQELLTDSRLSIKEVSAAVGYLNTSLFDRNFRHCAGITPSQYRDRLRLGRSNAPD